MIAKLNGKISAIFSNFIILDVNGVGYKVEGISGEYEIGKKKEVFVYTHVRENDIRLFGFNTKEEFLLFKELLNISGVGPKIAVLLINNIGINTILQAIQEQDPKLLRTPGVGQRTTARIIVDLLPKAEGFGLKLRSAMNVSSAEKKKRAEVKQALINLGYNNKDISTTLCQIKDIDKMSSEKLLKEMLLQLSE